MSTVVCLVCSGARKQLSIPLTSKAADGMYSGEYHVGSPDSDEDDGPVDAVDIARRTVRHLQEQVRQPPQCTAENKRDEHAPSERQLQELREQFEREREQFEREQREQFEREHEREREQFEREREQFEREHERERRARVSRELELESALAEEREQRALAVQALTQVDRITRKGTKRGYVDAAYVRGVCRGVLHSNQQGNMELLKSADIEERMLGLLAVANHKFRYFIFFLPNCTVFVLMC